MNELKVYVDHRSKPRTKYAKIRVPAPAGATIAWAVIGFANTAQRQVFIDGNPRERIPIASKDIFYNS